jgi:hypothetical protein
MEALERNEWWDGKRWHAHDDAGTLAEAAGYKTAVDVLLELNKAMIGEGPVNGDGRVRAAGRFAQSANARAGEKTAREKASVAAWDVLVSRYGEDKMVSAPLDEKFLGDCAVELENDGVPAPSGSDDWLGKGNYRVRDLIRRHRKRLQPLSK